MKTFVRSTILEERNALVVRKLMKKVRRDNKVPTYDAIDCVRLEIWMVYPSKGILEKVCPTYLSTRYGGTPVKEPLMPKSTKGGRGTEQNTRFLLEDELMSRRDSLVPEYEEDEQDEDPTRGSAFPVECRLVPLEGLFGPSQVNWAVLIAEADWPV
ncbi:unnamed protein product [Vicia faba]|uniref:Uncharacterized protein n=1 Tax=Vicia faba TaxID=3906 RepID=A0AAV0ZLL5_VICFA|nr:unnamed protein product [Vicia faba]